MTERLRQSPGEEARQAMAVTGEEPPPSRWTLRSIRATFPWLQDYSLSGVWRTLQRCQLRLRSARVRLFSPDPDYAPKVAYLCQCLQAAAAAPEHIVLLFLDEMGYGRWPDPAPDWSAAPPGPAPVAERGERSAVAHDTGRRTIGRSTSTLTWWRRWRGCRDASIPASRWCGCPPMRRGSIRSRSCGDGCGRLCSRCTGWRRTGYSSNNGCMPFWIGLHMVHPTCSATLACSVMACWHERCARHDYRL